MPSIEQNVNFQSNSNENQAIDDGVEIIPANNPENCSLTSVLHNVKDESKFPIPETILEADQKLNSDKKPKNEKKKKFTSQSQSVNRLRRTPPRYPITETVLERNRKRNADKKPKDKKTKNINSQSKSVIRTARTTSAVQVRQKDQK